MSENCFLKEIAGSKSILAGLGISNIAVARYLIKNGGKVILTDQNKNRQEIQKIAFENQITDFEIYDQGFIPKADFLFRTPSLRPDSEIVTKAKSKGIIITSEAQLFFEKCKSDIYGITGSDGKTTTASLAYKLISSALNKKGSDKAFICGNIGMPMLDIIEKTNKNDSVITELSSFQLMDINDCPKFSAITNITPNHLDWHKSMQEYISAKEKIFSFERSKRLVIDFSSESLLSDKFDRYNGRIIRSYKNDICFFEGDDLYFKEQKIISKKDIKIKGEHNYKNILSSISLCYHLLSNSTIEETLSDFSGVKGRCELVLQTQGIKFYDSSIDSTPSRTINTLLCIDDEIVLICGGKNKNLSFDEFAGIALQRCASIIIYGESAKEIYNSLKIYGNKKCRCFIVDDFSDAVKAAIDMADNGSAVLLSPACASFDQFKNYKERSNKFKEIIYKKYGVKYEI